VICRSHCLIAQSILFNISLLIVSIILLAACGHHQPAPIEEYSASGIKRQLSADGNYYVRTGDTLYAIAFNFNVDPRDVAEWNEIPSPFVIYPGQKIQLTAPASYQRNKASSAVQISTVKSPGQTTTRAAGSNSRSSTPSSTSVPRPLPATAQKTAAPKAGTPATTSSASKTTPPKKAVSSNSADPSNWKWPASGRVLRGYVAGNPARNGLDISGKEGQAITATAAGQVVYSGNGLIGYGELIIIKHSEKMLSAYAHNKVRLVKEGEQVTSGQKIAEMGRNPSGDQLLHFEIRARGKPVNPLTYLPKR
jgi:lipoprotein NlpD